MKPPIKYNGILNKIMRRKYKCPDCGLQLKVQKRVEIIHPEMAEKGIGEAKWISNIYSCSCGYSFG